METMDHMAEGFGRVGPVFNTTLTFVLPSETTPKGDRAPPKINTWF